MKQNSLIDRLLGLFLKDTNPSVLRKSELTVKYLFYYLLVLALPIPFYFSQINEVQLFSSVFGFTGGLISLLIFYLTKSYRSASITYLIIAVLSSFLSMITYAGGQVELTIFPWFIVHSLFAFYTLGRTTGISVFTIGIIGASSIILTVQNPIFDGLRGTVENTALAKLFSFSMVSIFVYLIVDGYQKLYFKSNELVQHLLGEDLKQRKQFIDLNNQNYAMTEELLESQKELEENIISINNLNYKLHKTENHLVALQDANPVGVLIFDKTGESIYINPKGRDLLGLDTHQNFWLTHFKDQTEINSVIDWKKIASEGNSTTVEIRLTIQNKIRWIQALIAPIREDKEVTSFIGTIYDLTEQQKEKELLYLLYETINQSNEAFYVVNTSGRYVFYNELAAQLIQIEEKSNNSFDYNWLTSEYASWDEHISTLKENQKLIFEGFRFVDNQQFNYLVSEKFFEFDGREYIIGTVVDITSRVKIKEELIQKETSLSNAQKIARIGSFEFNVLHKKLVWSDFMYDLFEFDKNQDVSDLDYKKMIPSSDYEILNETITGSLKNENNISIPHRIIQQQSGKFLSVTTNFMFVKNQQGELVKILGTVQDMTEQNKVDQLHREFLELQLDNRKNQLELEERRIDLMQKNMQMKEERIRIAAVLTGQENERKRLSRELHDGIGQMLTAIKLKFEMIDVNSIDDVILQEKLEDIKVNIRKTIFETRKISQDLMPSALEDFGFASALRVLTEEFSLIRGIKVVFKDRKLKIDLPSEIRISLFRIVQEALANIIKHSDAKKVVIEISEDDNIVKLLIKDNGTTFQVNQIGNGLGINNMRERTELLNGLFSINKTEDDGCEISISIPIIQKEPAVLSNV